MVDMGDCKIQFESVILGLQKKQQDSIGEVSEQIEQMSKMKNKVDKDKNMIINEISEVRAATEEVNRSKNVAEKKLRELVVALGDIKKKAEVAGLNLGQLEQAK